MTRFAIAIIVIFIIIISFISPISKYVVEKYDTKFLGREITMDLPYINPLTGYVYLRNLKVYELNSDSLFFSATSLSVNADLYNLFNKSYRASEIILSNPQIKVRQHGKEFNFYDIVKHFSKKDTVEVVKIIKKAISWELSNIEMKNATIFYVEDKIPVNYFIREFNVKSKTIGGNNDTLITHFSFKSGPSTGIIEGDYNMNFKSNVYSTKLNIDSFDVSFLEMYVKDIANFANVKGKINADIIASGNVRDAQNLKSSGNITLKDCSLGKNDNEDYASFKSLNIAYKEINPKNNVYKIDSVSLLKPYFKYEKYDTLDNLQNMFGKNGANVKNKKNQNGDFNILFALGEYVKKLSSNFFKGHFKVNKIGIYQGDIVYNDYSLTEKFAIALKPLNLVIDSIERKNEWVDALLTGNVKPYGDVRIKMSINPKDSSDFKINYVLKNIPVSLFNPYLTSYTSFPLDRGTLEVKGMWDVNNGNINSKNNLLVIDPRVGQKQKINGAKWLPLKLAMFFIRDHGNVIDYDIPIVGKLNAPSFKLKDIVWDVITNIFIKPVTSAYSYKVSTIENEIENSLTLKWEYREVELKKGQMSFLNDIVDYLKDNEKTHIDIQSIVNTDKEREYITLFEGKKMYMISKGLINKKLTEDDSLDVNTLSIKDKSFNNYLVKKANNKLIFTVQERCEMVVGKEKIQNIYNHLLSKRVAFIKAIFKENEVSSQVKFNSAKNGKIPYDGYSFFKISYKGKIPEDLIKSYRALQLLDEEKPRDHYSKIRKEIKEKKK